jgi:hypothetical protein
MQAQKLHAKFDPGTIVMTRTVMSKLDTEYAIAALCLHVQGNWGTLDAEDAAFNDASLKAGGRLLSVYPLPNDPGDFYIVTEADRSNTTIMLPSDY